MKDMAQTSAVRSAIIPDVPADVAAACARHRWPIERLAEGLEALAVQSGLRRRAPAEALSAPPVAAEAGALSAWLDWAAARLGVECETVDCRQPDVVQMLQGAGPALVWSRDVGAGGFFLVLGGKGRDLRLIDPDLRIRACPVETLRTGLCWSLEAPLIPDIEATLELAGVAPVRRGAVTQALLRERLAGERLGGVWMLRLPAGGGLWRQLSAAGVVRGVGAVLGVFAAVYALEIWSWTLIGDGALNGRLDFGWLAAWLLVVVTLAPWRLLGGWFEAGVTLETGRIIKSRLLAGALRLSPDGVVRQGVGQLLGRVLEAQALQGLALSGGMALLVSLVELGFATWILGKGIAGGLHTLLLAGWLLLTFAMSWRYYTRLRTWSSERLNMTNALIEGMVGHRTRLAQERAQRRDASEDATLQSYLEASRRMDDAGALVLAGAPAVWMMAGLAGLAPQLVAGDAPKAAALAISIGGLMVAQRALSGVSGGLAALARAAVAWTQAAPLFAAGENKAPSSPPPPAAAPSQPAARDAPLLDARALTFAYPGQDRPVVNGVDLAIRRQDRILLQGGSGGGKSTLTALLTGLRRPDSGLMLLGGLDRHTLGEDWRRLATCAPQFHENHLLSGPLAFNLLMGRQWPPSPADMLEAGGVCEELGLGHLLRRMPAGLMQPVGETGWQLSHGERSRVFLARALLQAAPLTVLDESFAALDPETLATCLQTAIRRSQALVVVAHP